MTVRSRPISPHLQIYKPQITTVMSITHRFTGVVLCAGAVLLTYWLMAATYGPDVFATAQAIMGSWFGQLVLLGVVFSLWYHLSNGIRHLAWDAGWGFDLDRLRLTGLAVVALAVVLTVLTVVLVYAVGG